jgi:putative transposase
MKTSLKALLPNRSRGFSPVKHNPPHLYLNDAIYIVTSGTYGKIPYFDSSEKKALLQEEIFKIIQQLYAWVILDNHYHLLFELARGRELGKMIGLINGSSSYKLNRKEGRPSRKIWYSYWDTCIRNEKGFFVRLNYIHNNPVKHRCVSDLEELEQYQFSSYPSYLKVKGKEWLMDVFSIYPIRDFIEKGEP